MAFAHTTRGRGGVQKFFNGLVSGQSFLGKFFTHAASLNDGALSQDGPRLTYQIIGEPVILPGRCFGVQDGSLPRFQLSR